MPRPRKYFTAEEKRAARRRAAEKFRSTPDGRKAILEAQDRYEAKRTRWKDITFRITARSAKALTEIGVHVLSLKNLERPTLTFIDAKGRVYREDRRSAEELIEAWKRGEQ